jgi:transcriptional regulator with GAF, ATPase, and Fis domain
VLRVISSSPGDLVPVFETILALATRICEAKFGSLYLYDGKNYRTAAQHNPPPALAELRRQKPVFRAGPGTGLGRAAAAKQVVHIVDLSAEQAYIDRDPLRVDGVELIGARTALFVPMLKENTVIGTMTIFRQQVWPFTDNQIELVTNFAAAPKIFSYPQAAGRLPHLLSRSLHSRHSHQTMAHLSISNLSFSFLSLARSLRS